MSKGVLFDTLFVRAYALTNRKEQYTEAALFCLPAKIVKILQVVAICCVAIAFLITGYTVFLRKK